MTLKEFKDNIRKFNVPNELYSLEDGIKANAYILNKNYEKWDFFFLDEKGDRNNFIQFDDSQEAYSYLWSKLENEMKYPPSIPPKSVYGS